MSEFQYMLLGLLRDDCDYWLGYGDRCDKYLLTGSPQRQINKMLEIYDGLGDELDWISRDDILDYAERMGVKVVYVVYHVSYHGTRAMLYDDIGDWIADEKPVEVFGVKKRTRVDDEIEALVRKIEAKGYVINMQREG